MSEWPYMKLWIGDYLGDTTMLTTEEHGAYLLLLMAMWSNGGWLPNDHKKLAWICRMAPSRWKRVVAPSLDRYFIKVELEGEEVIQNKRLSVELQNTRKERTQKQVAAKAKWRKKKETNGAAACASHSHSHSHREEGHTGESCLGDEEEIEREVERLFEAGVLRRD